MVSLNQFTPTGQSSYTLLIVAIWLVFMVLSAVLFHGAEYQNELEQTNLLLQQRDDLVNQLNSYLVNSTNGQLAVQNLVEFYQAHGPVPNPDQPNWTFAGSFFFVYTIVTTIGYGNFVPMTDWGRLLVVFIGIIGLALSASLLTQVEKHIQQFFGYCESKQFVTATLGGRTKFVTGFIVLFWLIASWVAMINVDDNRGNKVNFVGGLYYVFVTTATIGFGDIVSQSPYFYIISVIGLVLFTALLGIIGGYRDTQLGKFHKTLDRALIRISAAKSSSNKTEVKDDKAPDHPVTAGTETQDEI